MPLGITMRSIRLGLWPLLVLSTVTTNRPLPAQELIRLPPRPVTITPTFAPEGLPNQFEEGATLPAAMSTTGEGDTWVACLAYSPDGSTLAVGDRPTRPLCTFLGDAPVNQNGGLIRIVELATRQVTLTIRPEKRPRHEYEVVSLAYTPDGRTLVAQGKEDWPGEKGGREFGYHVTAYDAATGRALRRIDSAKLDDWAVPVFSRDASTFSALTHQGVRVWDIATGHQHPAPEGGPMKAGALTLSPDGKRLAAGDESGEFGLWDSSSGRRLARFLGHLRDEEVYGVKFLKFSPDGRILACISQRSVEVAEFQWEYHSEIRLIDVATHTERATITGMGIEDAAFSPDGRTIAIVSPDGPGDDARGLVRLWDAATGNTLAAVHQTRRAGKAAFSADGKLLVTADREWVVLRDPVDGHERASLYQGWFTSMEEAIALPPDRQTLATSNGHFHLWDLRAATAPAMGDGHHFQVSCVAYSPDGRTLASGSFDQTIKLWNLSERRVQATLVGHGAVVVRVAYAPDGRAVASVDAGDTVRVWDTTTGACRLTLQGLDMRPMRPWLLSFSPDGKSLCLVSARYGQPVGVCRWDVVTGNRLPSPRLAADAPHPLAFSPDGALCVSAKGREVRVWDAASGALRSAFSAKGDSLGLLVSRDGETVFQRTQNGSVVTYRRVGETWNGEDLFASGATWMALGSEAAGEHMTASLDGRRVAAEVDGQLRVFDALTRRLIALLPPSDEGYTWLTFSPDGASLATGRTDGGIFLHRLDESATPVAHP
jgi:WD40 repeat protein